MNRKSERISRPAAAGLRGALVGESRVSSNSSQNGGKLMKDGLAFVMGVNLVIWCGIALYLFILDRRIKKLEQKTTDT